MITAIKSLNRDARRIGTLPLRPLPVLQTEQSKESIKYESILCRHRRRPKGRQDGNSAMISLFLEQPLRLAAQAAARAERRRHLPAARRAGGAADARRRRQRGGRDSRHCDHAVAGRTGVERYRLGCLRARLGRTQTARPECLGALAGRVDARLFPRQTGHAGARLGYGDRAGRRVGLGRAARASSASCRSASSSSRRSATAAKASWSRRLSPDSGQSQVAELQGPARLRSRRSCRADARRAPEKNSRSRSTRRPWKRSRPRRARHSIAASWPRSSRRRRRSNGGAMRASDLAAHRTDWVKPLEHGLSRLHAARDPAERPGHRGVDCARHPRALRLALASRWTAPTACTCRSRR